MKPVTDFYGRDICYRGELAFEGTPRKVFWEGFIEPFLEAIIIWSFDFAGARAQEKQLPLLQALKCARGCLSTGINNTYLEMQDIDCRLRGRGYPSTITPIDITDKISAMEQTLDMHYHRSVPLESQDVGEKQGSFFDAIDLKPNVSGIGVDLKKVWEYFRRKND